VFTARYALSPCIKQIRFVFKGLRFFPKYYSNFLGKYFITALTPVFPTLLHLRNVQATGLRAEKSWFDYRHGQYIFSLLQNIYDPEVHPAFCSVGSRYNFLEVKAGRGVKLTTHFHLILRLRSNAARPSLVHTLS
jgi:hypothetical protein